MDLTVQRIVKTQMDQLGIIHATKNLVQKFATKVGLEKTVEHFVNQ